MTVEVRGVWFPNKGSLLMLRAIWHHWSQQYPEEGLAVEAPWHRRKCLDEDYLLKIAGSGADRILASTLNRLPAPMRRAMHLAADGEARLVFDASGFAYGDVWGADKLRQRLGDYVGRRKRVPLILLPQAFGPFTNPALADDMRRVVERAALVFARDKTSLAHLQALVGNAANLRLAPDFTTLVPALAGEGDEQLRGRLCFVPNCRMIQGRDSGAAEAYLAKSARLIRHAIDGGQRPFVLLHETVEDADIAAKISALLGHPLEVFEHQDPLRLKAVIGGASGVITSRFHALVSALSQGVPALSMGWSHKYDELLGDYGVSELSLDICATDKEAEAAMECLIQEGQRSELSVKLLSAAEIQRERVEVMWREIGIFA